MLANISKHPVIHLYIKAFQAPENFRPNQTAVDTPKSPVHPEKRNSYFFLFANNMQANISKHPVIHLYVRPLKRLKTSTLIKQL